MKGCIATAMLAALSTAGSVAPIDIASAAKVITVPRASPVHAARYQRIRPDDRAYGAPYYSDGTSYYARPFFYIPAPFPLGFDFGFGW
jgi:hypothetical protein